MRNTTKKALARFSVSLPGELWSDLDDMVQARGFPTRSHAISDTVRSRLVEHRHQLGKGETAGTITATGKEFGSSHG